MNDCLAVILGGGRGTRPWGTHSKNLGFTNQLVTASANASVVTAR